MHSNTNYNNKNQPFAHQLRQEMTKAEACLWKYALKAGKMKGYSFRRQRPVLDFIVDFICIPLRLVIEIDGYSHFLDEVIVKDKIKEEALKEAGYKVIRYTDNQVLKDIQNVITEIEKIIEELERQDADKFAKVHPQPPPAEPVPIYREDIAIAKVSAKKVGDSPEYPEAPEGRNLCRKWIYLTYNQQRSCEIKHNPASSSDKDVTLSADRQARWGYWKYQRIIILQRYYPACRQAGPNGAMEVCYRICLMQRCSFTRIFQCMNINTLQT